MKAKEIIDILNQIAPQNLIDSWDNTGFQIGDDEKNINKVLIALDLDNNIANKAVEEGYDMIITHHPLIFKSLKSINNRDYIGRLIIKLISNDIVVYNAHSNLDLANGGVNDELARLMSLQSISPLSEVIIEAETYGYGRIGEIERSDLLTVVNNIKSVLSVDDIRVYGNKDTIQRLAVCGGSGSDFIIDAFEKNADMYITGDIKYHDAQTALQLGLVLVDAGHFNTEKIILPRLKDMLLKEVDYKVEIEIYMDTSVKYKIY
ncbi:MAG: Nif3-like dinuclear metal center hexameric protein [Tissierellia bacterium]|nr:Nif3-like dinuclear metal center hexameric protein [Tissierellia bacterium]